MGERRGLRDDGVPVDTRDVTQDIVVRAAVGAVVVGRLAYVLTHLDQFTSSPADVVRILAVTDGGLSFLGGVVGAALLCVPWIRSQGLSTPHVLDAAAPAVALGLVCGRLGDLVIGDHVGAPSGDFPLGWRCTAKLWDSASNSLGRLPPSPYPFDRSEPPTLGCFDVAVHQTALYDGVAAVIVLVTLLALARRTLSPGALAASLVLVYAPLRGLGDLLREDRRWLGLTGTQWALLVAAVAVGVWLSRRSRQSRVTSGRGPKGPDQA